MTTVECQTGVYDCDYNGADDYNGCASYNMKYIDMEGNVWIVILGAAAMCAMAFGVGANDAANAWGTSVGSGAISLRHALIVAGIFEVLGAVTLGYGVSAKLQQSVSDVSDENCWACGYCNSEISVFQFGMFASLISTGSFLLLATATRIPVSTTHAVVGAIVGMTISATGGSCVDWGFSGVGGIVASWVISPILAGVIAIALFIMCDLLVFSSDQPTTRIISALPFIFSLVCLVMAYVILIKSQVTKNLPVEYLVTIPFIAMVLVYGVAYYLVVPSVASTMPSKENREDTEEELSNTKVSVAADVEMTEVETENVSNTTNNCGDDVSVQTDTHGVEGQYMWDRADAMHCFRYLLLFNAALLSYAHGANDTANSTAPFSALYSVYRKGLDSCDAIGTQEVWVLFLAAAFVAIGVYSFGENVIRTVGQDLAHVDFAKGFCIQFATCITVLIASVAGFPVSSTHCQVGAVIFLGIWSTGRNSVSWNMVSQILGAWVVTVPVAGILSAALLEMFKLGL